MRPQESEITTTPAFMFNGRILAYLLATLLLFLLAINFMIASLQYLGDTMTETLLLATANPFSALFIGLLATAILQSSSTTTALIVALTASNSLTLATAIPMVMGANIGTTITSTVVSFGFINKRKEYKRALAAGSYHDFFNILTVIILFPLEYFYGILSWLSQKIAHVVFGPGANAPLTQKVDDGFGMDALVLRILDVFPYPVPLALSALVVIFVSILLFRRISARIFKAEQPEAFRRFLFQNKWKSFLWGALITAAIRSSTITTSIVVPIVAKKISSLRKAAPFILGANLGTTITAFIAALWNVQEAEAITIAMVHFLFNGIGICLFLLIPGISELPVMLANGLGRIAVKYRLVGMVYLLLVFFLIPFALIYLTR